MDRQVWILKTNQESIIFCHQKKWFQNVRGNPSRVFWGFRSSTTPTLTQEVLDAKTSELVEILRLHQPWPHTAGMRPMLCTGPSNIHLLSQSWINLAIRSWMRTKRCRIQWMPLLKNVNAQVRRKHPHSKSSRKVSESSSSTFFMSLEVWPIYL